MSYKPFTTEYTWQIIDDIKEYLEETNKDQTTLDTLDLCHLIGETERLNNIINELEKYLDVQSKIYLELDKIEDIRIGCQLLRVKDKLKELKDSDNSE